MLDIIDKHNAIVTTAAASIQLNVKTGIPGTFIGSDGNIHIGGTDPGGAPFLMDAGQIQVAPKFISFNEEIELHRSPPGFNEEVGIAIDVVFGKGPSGIPNPAEAATVLNVLGTLVDLVQRVLEAAERRAL